MTKTGTSSLHAGLSLLGATSCHHLHNGERGRVLIEKALTEGKPALAYFPEYDAYSDMALYEFLDVLDREHPESKYIWTVRPQDSWVNSVRAHNERRSANGKGQRPTDEDAEAAWLRERERVYSLVSHFFAARPDDLLTMDIVGGDGWEKLCPFLGVAIPDVAFPHRNQRPASQGRRRLGDRLRRRGALPN